MPVEVRLPSPICIYRDPELGCYLGRVSVATNAVYHYNAALPRA